MTKLIRFDWAIKYLLRHKANFDVLEGFLSELLGMPITIESILESESNKSHADDKFNRVDLLVQANKGKRIIIEVQCMTQWDYLSRILYGTSKVVCEHLREGQDYYHINKVISVNIVFFDLGGGKDYLYKGSTVFKGLHFDDTLTLNAKEFKAYSLAVSADIQTPEHIFPEYYIIKVMHFQKQVQDKIDEWIYFLKYGEIKKEFNAQGIQSAAQKLDVLRLSEEERSAYEQYRESLHDNASFDHMVRLEKAQSHVEGRAEGRVEGLAEGRLEGRSEERQNIARSLKQAGLSNDEISQHTGLSVEKIRNL